MNATKPNKTKRKQQQQQKKTNVPKGKRISKSSFS